MLHLLTLLYNLCYTVETVLTKVVIENNKIVRKLYHIKTSGVFRGAETWLEITH